MASIGTFTLSRCPGRFDLLMSHFDGKEVHFEFLTRPADDRAESDRHLVIGVITSSERPDHHFSTWRVGGPVRRVDSATLIPGLHRFHAQFSSITRRGWIELFT